MKTEFELIDLTEQKPKKLKKLKSEKLGTQEKLSFKGFFSFYFKIVKKIFKRQDKMVSKQQPPTPSLPMEVKSDNRLFKIKTQLRNFQENRDTEIMNNLLSEENKQLKLQLKKYRMERLIKMEKEQLELKLIFDDKETLKRFWDKCQELFEECAVTMTPSKEAYQVIKDDIQPYDGD